MLVYFFQIFFNFSGHFEQFFYNLFVRCNALLQFAYNGRLFCKFRTAVFKNGNVLFKSFNCGNRLALLYVKFNTGVFNLRFPVF